MSNYYIHEGFTVEQLRAEMEELQSEVRQLGEIYEKGLPKDATDLQKGASNLAEEGYSVGEQIHDTYSEMGAVREALKWHGVEV